MNLQVFGFTPKTASLQRLMLRKGVMSPRLQIEAVGRVQTAPPSSLGALGPKGGKTNAHFSKGKWRHHHPASQRWCDNNDIQSPSPPGGEVPCPPLRLFLQSLRFLRDMKTCNSSYGTRNFLHVFHPTPTSPHHSEKETETREVNNLPQVGTHNQVGGS